MTEQEKQEIIAEIRKSVMEEMKQAWCLKIQGENGLDIRFLRTTENWQSNLIETKQRMCGIASEN